MVDMIDLNAPGCDNVPVKAYRGSVEATKKLFRICCLVWHTERIPPELVRGMFVMLHKKWSRDDYRNYRAMCLLCHSLQVDVCHRGTAPDDYSGGPPTRYTGRVQAGTGLQGQRWFIQMILREGRQAVITFIDYSAAFDTES